MFSLIKNYVLSLMGRLSAGSSGLVHVGTFTVSGGDILMGLNTKVVSSDAGTSVQVTFASQTVRICDLFDIRNNTGIVGIVGTTAPFAWNVSGTSNNAGDLKLYRDAANTLAQRNGTAAQTARWYSTYTDGSNYERLAVNLTAGGSSMQIAAETAGTGVDNIDLLLTPAGTGNVRFGTHSALAAETVTGYITIKDAAGNSRKIAVVS